MGAGDGNGWVLCRCGCRHWGRYGAAGLLLARPCGTDGAAGWEVLLQLRAQWTHLGGTWGIPGGAVDSHEDAVTGALRETHEETGVRPEAVEVLATTVGADHVDWSYHVVLGRPRGPVWPTPATAESDEVRWFAVGRVDGLPLHPGFAVSWPALRARVESLPA